jgi:3-oxoacyl-[acyl-carrier-protein] synthase II
MNRRVVITGVGLISSLGDSPAALFAALREGRSAIGGVDGFDVTGLNVRKSAAIKGFVEKTYLGIKNLRPLDRTARLVTAAAKLAVDDAGLNVDALKANEAGLALGTMFCSVRTISEFDRRAITAGVEYASVLDFANTVINAAAGQTAIWHGLRGLNATICGGVTSGLQALSYAADMIRLGRSKLLLAGGGEELSYEELVGFSRAGWLAPPEEFPIPFDRRRNGLIAGEGAALMVLEDEEFARGRQARVRGVLRGHSIGFDRSRGKDLEESAGALARCIRQSLSDAGMSPADIALLSASAGGSPAADRAEASAVKMALGERCATLPVMAIKSQIGETAGAGGALQTIAALEAASAGAIPGVAGFEQADEGFPLEKVSASGGPVSGKNVLVTSMGLDGNCCALIASLP